MERLKEKIHIFFLHGFLGVPQDWEQVFANLKLPLGSRPYFIDYFHDPELDSFVPLNQWGKAFNEFVKSEKGTCNILVGYSLGGRLGLHALAEDSALWASAVFVSTNPGFDDAHEGFEAANPERSKRWLNDTYWAEKFGAGEWNSVLKAWNAQPIFGESTAEPLRDEKKYSREALSMALTNWSLAQQKNMRGVIKENARKVSWLVGDEDKKFVELSQKMQDEMPALSCETIPEAAHRVLFDQPGSLGNILERIIRKTVEEFSRGSNGNRGPNATTEKIKNS